MPALASPSRRRAPLRIPTLPRALCLLLFSTPPLLPATPADSAVLNVVRRADPTLADRRILYRARVSANLDLVIVLASPANWPPTPGAPQFVWSQRHKLGLLLQQSAPANKVYLLALDPGLPDCAARIERATSTDTVISCAGEKGYQGPNRKFIYDIRAKALIARFDYRPFAMMRVFARSPAASGGPVFVGSDTKRLVAVEARPGKSPPFQILGAAEAAPWLARVKTSRETVGMDGSQILYVLPANSTPPRFGPSRAFTLAAGNQPHSILGPRGKQYPLPQSSFDDFAQARPARVNDNYVRASTIIDEYFGPTQPDGGRLWFGKAFYDGEGNTGVGGFGYFDTADLQYHLIAPPELAAFSVSALRVAPDAVWLGIFQFGEYGGSPAGVLRYDRHTQSVRKYELPDAVYGFAGAGDATLLATSFGIAVIDGDRIYRYFIDRTGDGRLRVAEAAR